MVQIDAQDLVSDVRVVVEPERRVACEQRASTGDRAKVYVEVFNLPGPVTS